MGTYKNFFTADRIPGEKRDRLDFSPTQSDHVIVASRNQFFELHLSPVELKSEELISERLRSIIQLSKDSDSCNVQVGLLTTENRRVWSAIRTNMIKGNLCIARNVLNV